MEIKKIPGCRKYLCTVCFLTVGSMVLYPLGYYIALKLLTVVVTLQTADPGRSCSTSDRPSRRQAYRHFPAKGKIFCFKKNKGKRRRQKK